MLQEVLRQLEFDHHRMRLPSIGCRELKHNAWVSSSEVQASGIVRLSDLGIQSPNTEPVRTRDPEQVGSLREGGGKAGAFQQLCRRKAWRGGPLGNIKLLSLTSFHLF